MGRHLLTVPDSYFSYKLLCKGVLFSQHLHIEKKIINSKLKVNKQKGMSTSWPKHLFSQKAYNQTDLERVPISESRLRKCDSLNRVGETNWSDVLPERVTVKSSWTDSVNTQVLCMLVAYFPCIQCSFVSLFTQQIYCIINIKI